MYPSTKFIIEDRSQINDLQINEQISAPLFMQFFTSDKGPEEMGEYYGEQFKVFGTPNFARHGQPLSQAQRLINNGARVLAKRVVAPDATLANLVVLAKVKPEVEQKTNVKGEPLYIDAATGKETTVADGNTAINIKKAVISYDLQTITDNRNDIYDLKASALSLADYEGKSEDEEKIFPIILVADNGRGVSGKKFKITANLNGSRNAKYLSYVFSVIENSVVTESTIFTLNPNIVSATSNLSLESVAKTYLKEVKAFSFDEVMVEFLNAVKNATDIEDIDNTDVLFGKDKKGIGLESFKIEGDINLSIPVGMPLKSGTNGSFGNFPLKSENYTSAFVEALNGTFTKDIYDVDNILLDAVIDANYPEEVKKAIESIIEFREDAFFFRDLGVGLVIAEDIITRAESATKSRYIGVYGNSYDVIDEYSLKQITVTTGYTLAKILPKHFSEKVHAPVAGQLNGFIFDEIVEGTVNFLPKIIPGRDQKAELFAKHINFISYLDKVPVLESEFTTQEDYTGFSFINNTLAVQEVIKDIRVNCPKNRYSFMEEDDLRKYEEDIQVIINRHASRFSMLQMEYAADPTYEQNMIYYAILRLKFKKFVNAEVFRIIALNDNDVAAI